MSLYARRLLLVMLVSSSMNAAGLALLLGVFEFGVVQLYAGVFLVLMAFVAPVALPGPPARQTAAE